MQLASDAILIYAASPSSRCCRLCQAECRRTGLDWVQSTTEFVSFTATPLKYAKFVRVLCLAAACCQLPSRQERSQGSSPRQVVPAAAPVGNVPWADLCV